MSHRSDHITCHILCCAGSSCRKNGADDVLTALKHELKEEGLHKHVHITKTHCNHECKHSPVVMVYPDGVWYEGMTPKLAKKLVKKHIRKGKPLKRNILRTIPY